jgi:hypothetical protein
VKIYFSQANQSDLDFFGYDDIFEVDDKFYYNGVEFGTNAGGTEEVRIFDSCDRSIPISVDQLHELIAALQHCLDVSEQLQDAEKLMENVSSNKMFAVISDEDWAHVQEV